MSYMFFFTAFLPLIPFYIFIELYFAFFVVVLVKRATRKMQGCHTLKEIRETQGQGCHSSSKKIFPE